MQESQPQKPHFFERWNGLEFVPTSLLDVKRGDIIRHIESRHHEWRAVEDARFGDSCPVVKAEPFATRDLDLADLNLQASAAALKAVCDQYESQPER